MNNRLKRLWATKTKDDEWWSSFVTSPLAIAANYWLVDRPWLTPNRITALSFIAAVIAAVCIVMDGTNSFIIAAILIHVSHILDCMDGQMARYRKTSSAAGSYFDRLTDQAQVILWFGAAGYTAYASNQNVVPLFLAFIGTAFYGLRGYAKYVAIQVEISLDADYLTKVTAKNQPHETAGLSFGWRNNLQWLLREQRKVFNFDEGVFIFMLSLALVLNNLDLMLWVFALSQLFYGSYRAIQHGLHIQSATSNPIQK
jgi:phosphatidylglycerophosphate synthase